MLYLVQPNGRLLWNDLPASLAIPVAKEHGADLARLDWQPSERIADTTVIRLALRHGVVCSTGLIIEGIVVSDMLRPVELATLSKASQESSERSRAAMPDELMEQLMPGWKEHGRHLDQEIAESMAEAIEEAQGELDELLASPVSDALRAHWLSLHGIVPRPE